MSEKRQSTEANIDMNQMLKLSDCFNKQLGILLKQMKKKKTKTENLNKEIEVTKKSQMEVIELKNSYQNKKLTGSAQQ